MSAAKAASVTSDTPDDIISSYQVDLDVFHGPLDLLLYLIRKEEVDINDIPIARITRQYLQYLDLMQNLNLEVAGEFLLMAATLIRIKTRLLLPRDENEDEDADPREELILALVEYKKFKEAAEALRERALLEEQYVVPPSPLEGREPRVELVNATTLFDLVKAYAQIGERKRPEIVHEVIPEEISLEERMVTMMALLRNQEGARFEELISDSPRRPVAVVSFIAMLELARSRRLHLEQSFPFRPLWVYRGQEFAAGPRRIDITAISGYEQIDSSVDELYEDLPADYVERDATISITTSEN